MLLLPRGRTFGYVWRAAVAVVAVSALFVWTRQAHAAMPWSVRPERISYCGRDYQRNPTWMAVPASEISYFAVGAGRPLEEVGRIPPVVGQPVLARKTVPVEGWAGLPCTGALLLKVGDDTYVSYDLVGGP